MSANRIRMSFVLALMAFAIPAAAQTGSISGKVTTGGKAVVAATVRASSGVRSSGAQTDENGVYRITGLEPGTYSVTARHLGYTPVTTASVSVGSGATGTADFSMVEAPSQLNEVVTVGSRAPEKVLDAPATISVVTSAQVEERAAVNITDHVVALPGIDVARGGIARSNIVARGFNNIFSGALMTLTDNRFAFVPSLRVNIPYLSPTTNEDIDRIEVVLGPAAALYGPNTASGVMAVTTKSPFTSPGTSLTVDGGNQNLFRGSVRTAWAPTPKFGFKVTGDGFRAKEWDFLPSDTIGERKPRDRDVKRWGGEARADFRPTPGSEIIANYGISKALSAVEPTGLGPAQVKDWLYQTYQLRARVNQLFAQVFLNSSNAGGTFLLNSPSLAASTNCPDVKNAACIIDRSKQFAAQLQDGLNIGTRQRFLAGIDYIQTLPKTEGTLNGRNEKDDNITETGGYVHSVTDITNQFQVTAAARVDKHSRLEDPVFSPRLALSFKPNENNNFRITYNRAFSTPSTNNLFLDLEAQQIASGGVKLYGVRALGVPNSGLTFSHSCTGGVGNNLCMKVPTAFTGTAAVQSLPAQAALLYKAAFAAGGPSLIAALTPALGAASAAQIIGFLASQQPTAAEVGTKLRILQSNRSFVDVNPANLIDVNRLKPEIHSTYEAGYKGILGGRLQLSLDAWKENRKNFVGPLAIETPNVFLDATTLGGYVGGKLALLGLSQAQIGALAPVIAGGLGGVSGSTAAPGVPLGVVNFAEANSAGSDVIVTYRNFGNLDLWGSDLGAELLLDRGFSVLGTYAYVNKNFFSKSEVGGITDISLNAPANKHSVTLKYRDDDLGFSAELRERHVDAFRAEGFISGSVRPYTLLDAGVSYRPASLNGVLFAINGTNIANKVHQEFAQGNLIGRLIITRVQYTF